MNPLRHRARRLAVSALYDGAFTLKIDTTKAGSESDTFVYPVGTGYTMNALIAWGDGTSEKISGGVVGNYTHVYPAPGVYIVRVWELVPGGAGRLYFYNGGDKLKVLELLQWGQNKWDRLESSFYGCSNLIVTAKDAWKARTASASNFKETFRGCTSIKSLVMPPTCGATNFQAVFQGCSGLTEVPYMDTSKNTNLVDSFAGCTSLKAFPLLPTGLVTNWTRTFDSCSGFTAGYDFPTLDMHSMSNGTNCFYWTALSKAAYNSMLDQLANGRGPIPANANNTVTFYANLAHYDSSTGGYDGTAARATLTGAGRTWNITDAGTP